MLADVGVLPRSMHLQSSSGAASDSTSCSCSSSGSDLEAEGGPEMLPGTPNSSSSLGRARQRQSESNGCLAAGNADGSDALALPRRQRPRRLWRDRSQGGTANGEISSGPIPQGRRRRSEVGSVLEPEAHSDTEDVEVSAAAMLVHA
jgi:hypothetical protein